MRNFQKEIISKDNNEVAFVTLSVWKDDHDGFMNYNLFAGYQQLLPPSDPKGKERVPVGEVFGFPLTLQEEDVKSINRFLKQPKMSSVYVIENKILPQYLTKFLVNRGMRIQDKKERKAFYQQYFSKYVL